MPSKLAIYWPGTQFAPTVNAFGMHVANLGLLTALIRHGGFDELQLLSHGVIPPETLAEIQFRDDPGAASVQAGGILDLKRAAQAGALLRGNADLAELAWLRRQGFGDRAFSLIGLVHSLAPPATRQGIAAASIAPIQPWDALICTSPSVQQALERLFDEWEDYLADRFGGTRRQRPQLPLMPLGVDQAALQAVADRPAARAAIRAELGLADEDILVLWVGRLSFFEKAFPQPMFRAVEEAAQATGRRVHFAMAGWFPVPAQRDHYERAARAHAPSTPVHFIDGNDKPRLDDLWAGADIFLSLVDNIQETFGITPLEAMAAGLPVVASDWDGYRYTVRDGREGFLIPTLLAAPGGLGRSLIARHALKIDTYQTYVGSVAQHTAVHIGRAEQTLAALIRSPDLRRRMGAAGRARVRDAFDWPVVAAQMRGLVDQLAAIRSPDDGVSQGGAGNPVKGDPFRDFAGFATESLGPDTRLSLRPGIGPDALASLDGIALDQAFGSWRVSREECQTALRLIAGGPITLRGVVEHFPEPRRPYVELTVVWLAKHGLLDWLPPAA